MSQSIERAIARLHADSVFKRWKIYTPKLATKKRHEEVRRACLEWFRKPEKFCILFEGTNTQIRSFAIATCISDVKGLTIAVICTYAEEGFNKSLLQKWINEFSDHFKEAEGISFRVNETQPKLGKLLKKLGADFDSYELIGSSRVSVPPIQSRYRYALATKALQIKALVRIERLAHEADPSSRIYGHTKRLKSLTADLLKSCRDHGTLIVAFDKEKPIGFLALGIHNGEGAIYDIAVDPKYQGQGVGKHLYSYGLGYLRERKCEYYRGGSSTQAVLGISKLLDRKIINTNYHLGL